MYQSNIPCYYSAQVLFLSTKSSQAYIHMLAPMVIKLDGLMSGPIPLNKIITRSE